MDRTTIQSLLTSSSSYPMSPSLSAFSLAATTALDEAEAQAEMIEDPSSVRGWPRGDLILRIKALLTGTAKPVAAHSPPDRHITLYNMSCNPTSFYPTPA